MDNVDSAEVLFSPPSAPEQAHASYGYDLERRIDYFPYCSHGTTLITSRSRGVAKQLAEMRNIVDVEPMDEYLAHELLGKKLHKTSRREDLVALAVSLDFLPLAMVQAAAYINHRAPLCTIQDYLNRLEANDASKTRLLQRDDGDLRRDREASNSIIRTWQVSFDHVSSLRQSAADLLSLMSFFDRQSMPKSLLLDRGYGEEGEWIPRVSGKSPESPPKDPCLSPSAVFEQNDDFDDDISMLRDYAFISTTTEPHSYGMHRLVQVAMRTWLQDHGDELEKWKFRFVANLEKAFAAMHLHPTTWFGLQPFFPHAKLAFREESECRHFVLRKASLLQWSADYALRRGLFTDAENMLRWSLNARNREHGKDSLEASDCMEVLSAVKIEQGEWHEAESLQVQAIKHAERILGDSHRVTLGRKSRLATIFWYQNRMTEADALRSKLLQQSKETLGKSHNMTLAFMGALARLRRQQYQLNEAEALHRLVCKRTKETKGSKLDMFAAMQDLSQTLQHRGRHEEAQELQKKAIEISKALFGDVHPYTLESNSILVSMYTEQDRLDEAEALQINVVSMAEDVLGRTHPHFLSYKSKLASIHFSRRDYDKATSLYLQIFDTWKDVHGPNHPLTIESSCRLAGIYTCTQRLAEAEKLYLDALQRQRTLLGDGNLQSLRTMAELASTYWAQKRLLEAAELQRQVSTGHDEQLGGQHPDSLRHTWTCANIYYDLGLRGPALQLMQNCVEASAEILGEDHRDTVKRREWLEEWREGDRNLRSTGRFYSK